MSMRLSVTCPARCSGLMYFGVPRTQLAGVALEELSGLAADCATAGSNAVAKPKSSSLTTPSDRSLMFAGLRSRWTIPRS